MLKIHCYCCLFMLRDVSLYHKLTKPLFCQHWAFSLNGIMQITHRKKRRRKKNFHFSLFCERKKILCEFYSFLLLIHIVGKCHRFRFEVGKVWTLYLSHSRFFSSSFFSYEFYAWTGKFSVCSVARRHKIVALLLLLALSCIKHKAQTDSKFLPCWDISSLLYVQLREI